MIFGLWRKTSQTVFQPRLHGSWWNYYFGDRLGDTILNAVTLLMICGLIHTGWAIFTLGAGGWFR